MFCPNCETPVPHSAKFCMNCGIKVITAVNTEVSSAFTLPATTLVPAKCTTCGASLTVDMTLKAAICPYCNSAYIVEQAIQSYQLTVNGRLTIETASVNVVDGNVDNLILRAAEYETAGDYTMALKYYNNVLDIDIMRKDARDGVLRIKELLHNYVYYQEKTNRYFTFGMLQLKRDMVIFKSTKGVETIYPLDAIHNLHSSMGCLCFMYCGKMTEITFAVTNCEKWIELICQAQNGLYPPICGDERKQLLSYIASHFTSKNKMAAIKYYKDHSNVTLADAKREIDQLFITI